MFHKFDSDIEVNEEYKKGYIAGLMMDTHSTGNKTTEFARGYYSAMADTIDLYPENCC